MARTGFLNKILINKKMVNKSYISFKGNFIKTNSIVKREIHFKGREQYYIEINSDEGQVVRFEFTYSINRTKVFKLTEGKYFNDSDIRKISNDFNLELKSNPYSKTLTCSIPDLSEDYGYAVYGAEVNTNMGVYLCVFAKKGQSVFVENDYFINGIYKIFKGLSPIS